MRVFAICGAQDIARGEAQPFSLLSVEEDGQTRPFPIVVTRAQDDAYHGYRNRCPHEGVWLNIGADGFLTPDGARLRCGQHGAIFEIDTGLCVEGPCEGESLYPLALLVIGGDVCLLGEAIVEDTGEDDETMEIMIHPD